MSAASPPEQLSEATSRPGSGPPTCSSLSVSSKAGTDGASAMPMRFRKADVTAAEPASEAVCERARRAPVSLRPNFNAATGTPCRRALAAAAASCAASPTVSITRPMAVMRSSSSSASITAAALTAAQLPSVATTASGSPRRCMVSVMAMFAALGEDGGAPAPPVRRRAGRATAPHCPGS